MGTMEIVNRYQGDFALLGADPTGKMLKELQQHRRWMFGAFCAVAVVVALVIGFAVYFIATNSGSAASLKIASAITGSSVAGLLGLLLKLWADWGRADMLAALLSNCDKATRAAVIMKLAKVPKAGGK